MKKLLHCLSLCLVLALILSAIPGSFANAEEAAYELKPYAFPIEAADDGAPLEETSIGEYFRCKAATGDSVCAVESNGVCILDKYAEVVLKPEGTEDFLDGPYALSVKITSTSNTAEYPERAGIYVRAVAPELVLIENSSLGANHAMWFYEWDWYNEHGGTQGTSSTGGSGVKLTAGNGKINIGIKCRPEDGSGVLSRLVSFDAPEGVNTDELVPFRITDDNKGKIEVFVGDTLIGTVEYSGAGYFDYDHPVAKDNDVEYYKEAVIKAADGTEMLKVTDARIAVEEPVLAIGSRSGVTHFSDLTIYYSEPAKPTDAPATEEPAVTDAPQVTDAPVKTDAPVQTDAPVNTGDNAATDAPTKTPADKTSKGPNVGLIIGICAAVVVISVVVIILASKKKTK